MKKSFQLIAVFILLSIPPGSFMALNAQNAPVAINDNYIPIISNTTTLTFNLLENDYDPDGDLIKIKEIVNIANPQDTSLIYSDSIFTVTINLYEIVFKYRICEVNNIFSISNWAYIDINGALSADAPVAKNDTITILPLCNYFFNPLLNDIDPNGDSLYISYCNWGQKISDSIVLVNIPFTNYSSLYSGEERDVYIVNDFTSGISFDFGRVLIKIENVGFYDSLNINNINAMFNCFGNHFWDQPFGPRGARFYVPNGSLIPSIFSSTFWIGGLDQDNLLHLAAERYRQVGEDYWHGPISNVYDSSYDLRWFHIWKINRTEVEYHMQHWWNTGYVCSENILSWPGNGVVTNGQALKLAPFFDNNNNDIYEPMEGDYPIIRGDQELFFILNDARLPHTETGGEPLEIEIQGSAYAFDAPQDSALWNTIFLHYDIYNRSANTYHDCYMGLFTDLDLGYPWDDYVGCNVQSGFYYAYNGDDFDEDSNWNGDTCYGYHEHPPAMGVQFLGGPLMDADGIDNPSGGCDESINGLNFGDTIVDNERLGMTKFIYFYNGGPAFLNDPFNASQYYSYLNGYWLDGSHLLYGGMGHANLGAVGPECNFMFPGDTDTCNWGTGGVLPNGGYNQNGYYWDEVTMVNIPGDRRGLGTSGPFTFEPAEAQQFDVAFVFGRDFNGTALNSVDVLKQRCEFLKDMFENQQGVFSNISSFLSDDQKILIYPNPSTDKIRISGLPANSITNYVIYDVTGLVNCHGLIGSSDVPVISLSDLNKGIYIIRFFGNEYSKTLKLIKK